MTSQIQTNASGNLSHRTISGLINYNCNAVMTTYDHALKFEIACECIAMTLSRRKMSIYVTHKCTANELIPLLSNKLRYEVGFFSDDVQIYTNTNVMVTTIDMYKTILATSMVGYKYIALENIGLVIFNDVHMFQREHHRSYYDECIVNTPINSKILLLGEEHTFGFGVSLMGWIANIRPLRACSLLDTETKHKVTHNTYRLRLSQTDRDGYLHGNAKITQFIDTDKCLDNETFNNLFCSTNYSVPQKTGLSMIMSLCTNLRKLKQLPAIFFLSSCHQCEEFARGLYDMHEFDEEITSTTQSERVLKRTKELITHPEVLLSKEYARLEASMVKGVAYHHGGMTDVLREMVQIMYIEGTLSVIFATESFAWRTSCIAPTVVLSSINHFDGKVKTSITSRSFNMMTRRATERIIHLTSLYKINSKNYVRDTKEELRRLIYSKDESSYKPLRLSVVNMLGLFIEHYTLGTSMETLKMLCNNMIHSSYYRSDFDWSKHPEEQVKIDDEINCIIEYANNRGYIHIDKTSRQYINITDNGSVIATIGDMCDGEMVILLLDKKYRKVPIHIMAGIFSLFIPCEVRTLVNTAPEELVTELTRREALIEGKFGLYSELKELSRYSKLCLKFPPDRTINNKVMCATAEWFKDETKTIEEVASSHNLQNVTLYKSLLKLSKLMDRLVYKCDPIDRKMNIRMKKIIGIIYERNVIMPSLFICGHVPFEAKFVLPVNSTCEYSEGDDNYSEDGLE